MSWMAAAVIGSSLIGGMASQNAADTQAQAANQASANQMAMFKTINDQNAPWRQAGQTALGQLTNYTNLPTSDPNSMLHQFNASDLNANLAPNYQWQMGQGLGAVQNFANSTGGLVSGNTLKGINDYAQNFAGNAYQQAFNNYQSQQSNIYNRLSNIAGLGQTANQTTAQAGTAAAQAASNYATGGAAAQAAGQVGTANAISGGINNYMGMTALNNMTGGSLWGTGANSTGITGDVLQYAKP